MFNKKRHIGFLIHPISIDQLKKSLPQIYPSSWFNPILRIAAGLIPSYAVKKYYKKVPAHRIVSVDNIKSAVGHDLKLSIIMLPFFPDQMIGLTKKVVLDKIDQCVKLANHAGVQLVSLGAFTSIVSDGGERVAERTKIAITSGNSLTAALCVQGMLRAAAWCGIDVDRSSVMIIGAGGDIGCGCAKYFSLLCRKLILNFRDVKKARPVINDIEKNSRAEICVVDNIKDGLRQSDLVLAATSSVTPVFELGDLKSQSILCDVSLPFNISGGDFLKRMDVFAFDGGRAKLPFFDQISAKQWKCLFPVNSIYGCLTEAITLGFENLMLNYSIGKGQLSVEKMDEIYNLSVKHGIELSGFSFGSRIYTKQELDLIRSNFSRREL